MDQRPLMVSIHCLVYNHEPYLRQCLDGFVMQNTNFRFEAVVHDDVSTDGSAAIIREYAEKYPDIIKPIFETENQYSKGGGALTRIMVAACTGKYVAMCEGDDYWIDPDKLQKQVDFLEANPDYSMCFHNAMEHWADNREDDKQFSKIDDKDYDAVSLTQYWIVPTASLVYRRSVITSQLYEDVIRQNFMFGDTPLILACAELGKVRGMSDVMSVYRRHSQGVSQSFNIQKYHAMADYQVSLRNFFHDALLSDSHNGAVNTCVDGFFYSIKIGQLDFSFLSKAWEIDKKAFIKTFENRIKCSIKRK